MQMYCCHCDFIGIRDRTSREKFGLRNVRCDNRYRAKKFLLQKLCGLVFQKLHAVRGSKNWIEYGGNLRQFYEFRYYSYDLEIRHHPDLDRVDIDIGFECVELIAKQ